MKYLLLLPLAACAGLPLTEGEQIEAATNIVASLATGNNSGAVMQALDVVFVLLGLKGAQMGGRLAKKKLVNPTHEEAAVV